MKIAIIGSGISGLVCARELNRFHDITVYEKAARLGGHTASKEVEWQGDTQTVDTGFIVFNDWTYPNFIRLMNEIEVESKPSVMSFSVNDPSRDFEYSGDNLNTLFAKRRHLISPSYWQMLRDILRFNRELSRDLDLGVLADDISLGKYLDQQGYSKQFCYDYIVPMASAIWSASYKQIQQFPLRFFARFFKNHGLLSVNDRPTWRVIKGGSSAYIEPLIKPFKQHIRLHQRIDSVSKVVKDDGSQSIIIRKENQELDHFDRVIFACHSDEALKLIESCDSRVASALKSLPYAENSVIMHTDTSLLPKRRRAWAAWNYQLQADQQGRADKRLPLLTYNMNILQDLTSDHTYCVSLNAEEQINPNKIIGRYSYSHPQFDIEGIAAQQNWHTLDGIDHMHFCGAYWANGFHEDGVVSALRVCHRLDSRCSPPISNNSSSLSSSSADDLVSSASQASDTARSESLADSTKAA